MPVVRQKAEVEASEIQAGPLLAGNTLPHTLELFRNHHQYCSGRRKNGVSYEVRVEFERTKWLKRKYMDNLRQQQALTGRLEGPRAQLSSSSDSTEGTMDTFNIKQSPGLPDTPPPEKYHPGSTPRKDVSTFDDACSSSSNGLPEANSKPHLLHNSQLAVYLNTNGHQDTPDNSSASVAIKTEPNSAENTPTCMKSPPQPVAMASNSKSNRLRNRRTPPGSISLSGGSGLSTPEPKRRRVLCSPRTRGRLSLSGRSISSPDDLEDDLALSPGRFMHNGELSTPPIKPLEEGDDPPITPSPPTSVRLTKSGESTSSSSLTSSSSPSLTPSSNTVTTGHVVKSQESSVSGSSANVNRRGSSHAGAVPGATKAGMAATQNSSLSKELHFFDQIMNQFTWEQSARDRRSSFSSAQSGSGVMAPHMQGQGQHPAGGTHVISPPPYFAAATSQGIPPPPSPHQYYHRPQTHILHRRPSVQADPYLQMQFASQSPHPSSPHHPRFQMHTQVVPTSPFSLPPHPHSPVLVQPQSRPPEHVVQRHAIQSTQPSLVVSPTIHTPIATHVPAFPSIPANQGIMSSVTAPNGTTSPPHHPHTPTTPLEHFNSFPPPSCPVSSQYPLPPPPPTFQSSFPPSTLSSGYQYPLKMEVASTLPATDPNVHTALRSPTVSIAGMHWDGQRTTAMHMPQQQQLQVGSSLRQALLSQVNSRVEALSGQKLVGGVADPVTTAGLGYGYTSPKVARPGVFFHVGSDLPLRPGIGVMPQQLAPPPTQFPTSYTGASSSPLPQPHTISYQGHVSTPFPHQL